MSKSYFGLNLESKFISITKNFVCDWDKDVVHSSNYISQWKSIKYILKTVTGLDFYFSRNENYFGICTEDGDFLIKIYRKQR